LQVPLEKIQKIGYAYEISTRKEQEKNMKAVLFDLDGTLIDSSEGIIKSAQYSLEHYGIKESDFQKLRSFIGPPLMYSFKNLYGFSEEKAREAVGVYRERYNRIGIFECSLYPGVRECIERLKEMGYLIGMASSKPEESCRRILAHFELLELFDDVVGATMDGRIDTKEEVLSEVLRRWHEIPKEEMCLIGDTIFDVEGANQKEIPCICVSYGFGNVEEMLSAGALKICDSMSELPQAISGLVIS
jgi:phosphoglycolate phosphatase